jgi:hypothetical protein
MNRECFTAQLALALAVLTFTALPLRAQEPDTSFTPGAGRMVRGTGDTFQIDLTANTRIRKGRDPIKPADVHPGDGVGAMGELDVPNHTVHALFVSVVDAAQIKQLRDNMGKTYITGKVTAINDLKLTILRTDGVTQTITVDEDTSFRKGGRGAFNATGGGFGAGGGDQPRGERNGTAGSTPAPATITGGESITLADIKTGDQVAGQGALKNGVFIPTQLAVIVRSEGGRRRHQQGEATSAPATEPK